MFVLRFLSPAPGIIASGREASPGSWDQRPLQAIPSRRLVRHNLTRSPSQDARRRLVSEASSR
jgi:hypothetical protein